MHGGDRSGSKAAGPSPMRDDPSALARRLGHWLWIGYTYPFLLLAGTLTVCAIFLWILWAGDPGNRARPLVLGAFIAFGSVAIGVHALRNVWKRQPPLTLPELTRAEAPALFARVEQVRQAMGGPSFASIRLVDTPDISLVWTSRAFGLFGAGHHLAVGLPLLQAIGAVEFDALVAAQVSIAAGPSPRLAFRRERAAIVWQYFGSFVDSPLNVFPWLRRFYRWWNPRCDARAVAFDRGVAFAADAAAARIVGADEVARALVSRAWVVRQWDEHWGGVWSAARDAASPLEGPRARWVERLEHGGDSPSTERWLSTLLARREQEFDPSPSLGARVRALGVAVPAAGADAFVVRRGGSESAADALLGALAQRRTADLDAAWRGEVEEGWRARHEHLARTRVGLDALVARDLTDGSLNGGELLVVSKDLEELGDGATALDYARRAVEASPDDPAAHFHLGRLLLYSFDTEGITHLRRAIALDVEAVPAAHGLIREYYALMGDELGALAADIDAQPGWAKLGDARREREVATVKDAYLPAALTPEDRRRLLEVSHADIGSIWVVRKVVAHSPERPLLVAMVQSRSMFHMGRLEAVQAMTGEVREALAGPRDDGRLPERDLLVYWWGGNEGLLAHLRDHGAVEVVPRQGTIAPRPRSALRRHVNKAWWLAVPLVAIGSYFVVFVAPMRTTDYAGALGAAAVAEWNARLDDLHDEVRADVHLLVDSAPARLGPRNWATLEFEKELPWRKPAPWMALITYDLRTGEPWIVPGFSLMRILPRRFVQSVAELAAAGAPLGRTPQSAVDEVFVVVRHRLREASLSPEVPLRIVRPVATPLTDDERQAAPTARIAIDRYREWLKRSAPDAATRVVTDASRAALVGAGAPSPLLWSHWRHLYVGELLTVVERDDRAVAFASVNPLVPPLFLRRGADGWQVDLRGTEDEVFEVTGAKHTWSLYSMQPYGGAFGDLTQRVGKMRRFANGANEALSSCGCRVER